MTGTCDYPVPLRPWACPDARRLLRADAPRADWLAFRRTGIGSSDASAVLGLSKWSSPYAVWADKLGLSPETPDNDAMELGRLLEPLIADRWAERSGIPVVKAGLMVSRERAWQMASVDRIAGCGGLVEIKTLSHRVAHEWDDGQVPDHAEAQSQHQLAVTGRSHVHVVGLQDGRTWLERVVDRDDALIEDMTKVERHFWIEYVLPKVEPPIDGSQSTTEVLNARWEGLGEEAELPREAVAMLEARRDLGAQIVAAKGRQDELDNRLRQLMGDHAVGLIPGVDKPVTYKRNGTFRGKAFAEDHPLLVEQLTVQRPALDVEALKRDYPQLYTKYRSRVLRVPVI